MTLVDGLKLYKLGGCAGVDKHVHASRRKAKQHTWSANKSRSSHLEVHNGGFDRSGISVEVKKLPTLEDTHAISF